MSVVYKQKEATKEEKNDKGKKKKGEKGAIKSLELRRELLRHDPSKTSAVEEFDTLSAIPVPGWHPIEKVRYVIEHVLPNGHKCRIDYEVYYGRLKGFGRAEVEFDNPQDATYVRAAHARGEKVLPDYIGEDVTDDKRYGSASLARFGVPDE